MWMLRLLRFEAFTKQGSDLLVDDHLWSAAVQLRTTVSGAALLASPDLALTRNRCPSLVTA
jgi:hypothetical protein